MFVQIFFSSQVKRLAIITDIWYIPVVSQFDKRFFAAVGALPTQEKKRLRKLGNIRKLSKPHIMIA